MKDIEEKEQIERFLKQLENPFGFLDTMREEAEDTDNEDDEGGQPKSAFEAIIK
jgi:hypothetical protein